MSHPATRLLRSLLKRAGAGDAAAWVAPSLILLMPFVNFARHHDYDLLSPESLLCIGLLGAIGLSLSAIAALRPVTLRHAVVALLIALFIDLQWGEKDQLDLLWRLGVGDQLIAAVQNVLFPALFVAILVATAPVRPHLNAIAAVVFGVMLVTTLLLPGPRSSLAGAEAERRAARNLDLPPIVHIVLDEQIGIEALPRDIADGGALRAELRSFYQGFGFTLFGRAFSHYHKTTDSLSNLMNGETSPLHHAHIEGPEESQALRRNGWFRRLAQMGYRLRVYQSDYLDFCADPQVRLESCAVFSANTLAGLMDIELDIADKAVLILENFLHGSFATRVIAGLDARLAPDATSVDYTPERSFWRWEPRSLSSLSSMALVERLRADLGRLEPGTAYFAHLLLPHFAYIFDSRCRTLPDIADWLNGFEARQRPWARNTEASRSQRYQRYFEQVRCAHQTLGELFEAMREAGAFDQAVVIVHGDHGSRLSLVEPTAAFADNLSDADILDSFATLFAVRLPDLPAGYDRSVRSIQSLFAELLLQTPMPDEHSNVYLLPRSRKANAPFGVRPMVAFPP